MNPQFLEWFGYGASILIVISLMMSSIVKLRWYNLAGAAMMSVYGMLIHAAPVALLNGFIVAIDIYYLCQVYFSRDLFDILQPLPESRYLERFLDFYKTEIQKVVPEFDGIVPDNAMVFFVLRNMVPACLFIAEREADRTLAIKLDFVIPEYRDFKIGHFLFEEKKTFFPSCGFIRLTATATTNIHARYLKRMGFTETDPDGTLRRFEKRLPDQSPNPCPMNCNCKK